MGVTWVVESDQEPPRKILRCRATYLVIEKYIDTKKVHPRSRAWATPANYTAEPKVKSPWSDEEEEEEGEDEPNGSSSDGVVRPPPPKRRWADVPARGQPWATPKAVARPRPAQPEVLVIHEPREAAAPAPATQPTTQVAAGLRQDLEQVKEVQRMEERLVREAHSGLKDQMEERLANTSHRIDGLEKTMLEVQSMLAVILSRLPHPTPTQEPALHQAQQQQQQGEQEQQMDQDHL